MHKRMRELTLHPAPWRCKIGLVRGLVQPVLELAAKPTLQQHLHGAVGCMSLLATSCTSACKGWSTLALQDWACARTVQAGLDLKALLAAMLALASKMCEAVGCIMHKRMQGLEQHPGASVQN